MGHASRHITNQASAKTHTALIQKSPYDSQIARSLAKRLPASAPEGLREEIELIADTAKLQSLLRAAIRSATLEEFAEAL